MTLDDLGDAVEAQYGDLDEDLSIALDRETRNELAMLTAALGPDETEETDELVRRAIHVFFQRTVETGTLDFHLRSGYDITYDEYLSGMTYDDIEGMGSYPQPDRDPSHYR